MRALVIASVGSLALAPMVTLIHFDRRAAGIGGR